MSLFAERPFLPLNVWPAFSPRRVTFAPSSRRRITVTQNSKSSKPSSRNTGCVCFVVAWRPPSFLHHEDTRTRRILNFLFSQETRFLFNLAFRDFAARNRVSA